MPTTSEVVSKIKFGSGLNQVSLICDDCLKPVDSVTKISNSYLQVCCHNQVIAVSIGSVHQFTRVDFDSVKRRLLVSQLPVVDVDAEYARVRTYFLPMLADIALLLRGMNVFDSGDLTLRDAALVMASIFDRMEHASRQDLEAAAVRLMELYQNMQD